MIKRVLQILCFIMILCMAGCGSPSASAPDGEDVNSEEAEDKSGTLSAPNDNVATVARGDNEELPKEGSLGGFKYQLGGTEEYDTKYKDWGYYRYEHDARAPLVLELCSGEHSTGGYHIRIVNLEADEEGNLCVTVEETAPKSEEVVTDAFTYPKATLLIYEETKMPNSVTVKTTGGMELPFLGSLPPKSEEDNAVGQEKKEWQKVVIAPPEGAYCNISLCLPEDWGWGCSQTEDVPVSSINLGIYPKAEGDANGCISIQYAKGFGVCGTGLESVETTFNGHPAYKGTYDGHPYWDFIALSNEYQGCAILNSAGRTWFDNYREELEEILATVEFQLCICDEVPLKKDSQDDIGEIYAKDPTRDDVVMSADGTKYVRNQLLVSAKLDCTKEKMENLGSAYGFEIVGYIELTQDYQIEFTRDMEEAELLKMIKILEEEDCVSMCTLNYVMELSYD